MPFIMVPVPEEHVNDVMHYIVRLQRQDGAELQEWDEDGIHQLFLEADEPTRSVLSFLALPGRAGKEVEPHEIAERSNCAPRTSPASSVRCTRRSNACSAASRC